MPRAVQLVSQGQDLEVAKALLSTERTGPKGERIPALQNTASHAAEVGAILQTITKAEQKAQDEATERAVVQHDEGMLSGETGKLAVVQDVTIRKADGSEEVLKASERQKNAVRQYVTVSSPALAKAQNETPEVTFNRELSAVANGGVEHPVWKARLEAAPLAASVSELSTPAKRDALLSAANLYDQLRQKNPLYLDGLIDRKTANYFESYRVAKQLPGKTMEEAADMARRASIEPRDDETLKGHYRTIEQTITAADPGTLWTRVFGTAGSPVNTGYLQQRVVETAKLFARLGLPADRAIDEAQKAVRETSTNVNGWIVPKLNTPLPNGFAAVATDYAKDFVAKYGKLNDVGSASDVGFSYDGAGTFTLVRSNGVALRVPGGLAHFTLKDLAGFVEGQRDKHRAEALKTGKETRAEGGSWQTQLGRALVSDAPQDSYGGLWRSKEHFDQSPLGKTLNAITGKGSEVPKGSSASPPATPPTKGADEGSFGVLWRDREHFEQSAAGKTLKAVKDAAGKPAEFDPNGVQP